MKKAARFLEAKRRGWGLFIRGIASCTDVSHLQNQHPTSAVASSSVALSPSVLFDMKQQQHVTAKYDATLVSHHTNNLRVHEGASLMHACLASGNLDRAENILHVIRDADYTTTTAIYNAFIARCAESRNLERLESFIVQMRADQLAPNSVSYAHLIKTAFAVDADVLELLRIYRLDGTVLRDILTVPFFTIDDSVKLLKVAC